MTDTAVEPEAQLPVDEKYADPASPQAVERTALALRSHGFTVEIVEGPDDARVLVDTLVPDGAEVFTATSETLRLSGIEADLHSGRVDSLRPKLYAMDYQTQRDEIRRMGSAPDVVVGSVHAVTESGTLVAASATGSQLGLYASGAGKVIFVVGAQKVVAGLDEAMRRIERYSWPLEDVRARAAYGRGSAVRKVLIYAAEADPTRTTVVLIRQAIGY